MVEQDLITRAKKLYPRKIEINIKNILSQHKIIILLGSRQVGKTSLIYRLILFLIEKEIASSKQILYLDLEFPHILNQINNLYGDEFIYFLKSQGIDTSKEVFVFIDEIHYLDNPSSFLKIIHDHYPNINLIVSGSSSLQIKHKFKDSLTGRKRIFNIHPLDFEEFLTFKNSSLSDRKTNLYLRNILYNNNPFDLKELKYLSENFKKSFEEYVIFGSYPGVILIPIFNEKQALLAEIYNSYIRKDIKDFARIENITAFNNLIELLGHQIGQVVNLSELTNSLDISRPTVENYLFLLENTFIISLMTPFYKNRRKEIIKSPKVFFHDTGIRNYVTRNFNALQHRGDKGGVFENAVFGELYKNLGILDELHFWRTKSKAEVDFIIRGEELLPIEVKYQSYKEPKITSSLRSFINEYQPDKAIIITKDFFKKFTLDKTTIIFIPAWAI